MIDVKFFKDNTLADGYIKGTSSLKTMHKDKEVDR